jgi:hypothetical protein
VFRAWYAVGAKEQRKCIKEKNHHILGQGGYKVTIPKLDKMEEDLLARRFTPASIN